MLSKIKTLIYFQNTPPLLQHAHAVVTKNQNAQPYVVKMCTTTHILGACKVLLKQGRYEFRHDTVLHKIIESLKSFILNIKQTVPISPKSFIKFVKKGTNVPCKRTPPVGILHHTDWVLLADIDNNYCFPIQIAFTQLRPDITIFSNILRKVILIELTCPCAENIKS